MASESQAPPLDGASLTRPRLVDATGTRRRLGALAALGHTSRVIGTRMGHHPDRCGALVRNWRRRDRCRVDARTAAEVAAVYELLRHERGGSHLARITALKAGYAPPARWDGSDIDDPAAGPAAHGVTREDDR